MVYLLQHTRRHIEYKPHRHDIQMLFLEFVASQWFIYDVGDAEPRVRGEREPSRVTARVESRLTGQCCQGATPLRPPLKLKLLSSIRLPSPTL